MFYNTQRVLPVFLWDNDLSVTDFVGDSSPGRGAKATACERNPLASPSCLPPRGRWLGEAETEGVPNQGPPPMQHGRRPPSVRRSQDQAQYSFAISSMLSALNCSGRPCTISVPPSSAAVMENSPRPSTVKDSPSAPVMSPLISAMVA